MGAAPRPIWQPASYLVANPSVSRRAENTRSLWTNPGRTLSCNAGPAVEEPGGRTAFVNLTRQQIRKRRQRHFSFLVPARGRVALAADLSTAAPALSFAFGELTRSETRNGHWLVSVDLKGSNSYALLPQHPDNALPRSESQGPDQRCSAPLCVMTGHDMHTVLTIWNGCAHYQWRAARRHPHPASSGPAGLPAVWQSINAQHSRWLCEGLHGASRAGVRPK